MSEWWETIEVTPEDVTLLASIYNDVLYSVDPWKYNLKLSHDLTKQKWYKDLVELSRVIASVNASPREYLTAQINEYKKPTKFARAVPTIKMMASPSGVDRWHRHLLRKAKAVPFATRLTQDDLIRYSAIQMKNIMESNKIKSEEEFFKDPYLLSQLSKSFLMQNDVFKRLVEEGFYQKTFGVPFESLLP